MNMTEFIRLTTALEKLGYNSDEILKLFKYVESGDAETLDEIVKNKQEETNK